MDRIDQFELQLYAGVQSPLQEISPFVREVLFNVDIAGHF